MEESVKMQEYKGAKVLADGRDAIQKKASGRMFELEKGVWTDKTIEKRKRVVKVKFLSEAYFKVLELRPDLKEALSLGEAIEVRLDKETILRIEADKGQDSLGESDIQILKDTKK